MCLGTACRPNKKISIGNRNRKESNPSKTVEKGKAARPSRGQGLDKAVIRGLTLNCLGNNMKMPSHVVRSHAHRHLAASQTANFPQVLTQKMVGHSWIFPTKVKLHSIQLQFYVARFCQTTPNPSIWLTIPLRPESTVKSFKSCKSEGNEWKRRR